MSVCVCAFRIQDRLPISQEMFQDETMKEREQGEKVFIHVEGLTQATNGRLVSKTPNLSKSKPILIGDYVN